MIEDRQAIPVCLNPTKLTMKRTLLPGFLLFCQLAVVWGKSLMRTGEKLNPYHYQTKAILTAIPGYIEMGGFNFTYGYGLNADAFIGKYLSVNAAMTTAGFGDRMCRVTARIPFQSDSY